MRTMASVWFVVFVLVAVQEVLGNVCNKGPNEYSCDECIRCGGTWCNERGGTQCEFSAVDGWCPKNQEKLLEYPQVSNPGDLVSPVYAERTLVVNEWDEIDIVYTARVNQKPTIERINSTQSFNIEIEAKTPKCTNNINCTTTIMAKPNINFCSSTGTMKEFVHVKVNVGGLNDTILLKYHVPCACSCSKSVEKKSSLCSGHGDYSCGTCTCYEPWSGNDCSTPLCPPERGDIISPDCISTINDLTCSGNGECGPCGTCVCNEDVEGAQYFDKENYCMDLCMVVGECEGCLVNNTMGLCEICEGNHMPVMYLQKHNSSLLDETDEVGRKVWVKCNQIVDDCSINYVTKKDEEGNVIVMVVETCNDVTYLDRTATPKVPIILAVVGILATVAAVAGVLIWKHLTALPPAPTTSPGYENIDAEDCTGMNPLYKPPTSIFNNPMYGNKW